MTPGWFLATSGSRAWCGHGDGHTVEKDTPMRIISGRIARCYEHTAQPVDWAAVQAVLAQREAQQAGEVVNLRGGFSHAVTGSLDAVLRDSFGIKGRKRPKPFSYVADEPAVKRASNHD